MSIGTTNILCEWDGAAIGKGQKVSVQGFNVQEPSRDERCLGFKAHSGWAALVALGRDKDDLHVIDRRRIELADPADGEWARQPYHAAEG